VVTFHPTTLSDGVTPILDLVVLNSGTNSFSFIAGNGDGTFNGSQIYTYSSTGSGPVAILTNDFNGDGNLDLAIVNAGSSSVSIFLGYGTGGFSPAPQSPILFPAGSLLSGIDSTDLNGDGQPDLVIANKGLNSISVFLGKGGGLFSPAVGSPISLSGPPQYLRISDINSDGRQDIIASLSSGSISILTGLGNGSFAPETIYSLGGSPSNLEIIDFNDDSILDVIAYQMSTGTLAFLPGSAVAVPNISLAVSDLDGNLVGQMGYLDINGNLLVGRNQTDSSGQFIVFNVPPGIKDVHMIKGGAGNRWMMSYTGGVTVGNISVIPPVLSQITYSGITADLVGSQIARLVQSVNISVLGSGVNTVSDSVTSAFSFNVDANTSMLVKVQK
jgi:VCBS repeat protein